MLLVPWDKKTVQVGDVEFVEWIFPGLTFLNSDGALGFEIDWIDENGTPCNRFGEVAPGAGCLNFDGSTEPGCVMCPELDNSYGEAIRAYSDSQAVWLADFSKAFQKMVDDLRPCRNTQLMVPVPSDA